MLLTVAFLYLQYKVWLKPAAEQSFLYGNHVIKSGLARMTENTPQYQGVVVYNMNDVPLVSAETHALSMRECLFELHDLACRMGYVLLDDCV